MMTTPGLIVLGLSVLLVVLAAGIARAVRWLRR